MIANPSIPHTEAKAMRNITEEPSNKSVLDSTFSSGGAGCERPQEISTERKLDSNNNSNNNNHESKDIVKLGRWRDNFSSAQCSMLSYSIVFYLVKARVIEL